MGQASYFSYLPIVEFEGQNMRDIFHRITFNPSIIANKSAFKTYNVKDGDTLDNLALKIYGDKRYYWIIALSNEWNDIFFDFPLSDTELRSYAQHVYDDQETGQIETYGEIYIRLYEENELKRSIKYLDPKYLNDFLVEVKRSM